jgi:hypothetical protein
MDADFVQLVRTLTAKHGKESLFDSARFRSRLPKNAESRFKKERHVLYIAIDMQAPQEIDAASELTATKQTLIDRLRNQFYIDEYAAKETIDLIAFILRGDRSLQITSAPSCPISAQTKTQGARTEQSKKRWLIAIVALIILLIVILFAVRNEKNTKPQEAPIDNEAKVILVEKR